LAFYGRSEGTLSVTYATEELTPATWADRVAVRARGVRHRWSAEREVRPDAT
jgi:hypothetical protein